MALIVLVRHGESTSNTEGILTSLNVSGYPLTEKGVTQAKRAAVEIKKLRVTELYSSPVLRARQTAEIIAKELGLKAKFDDRLVERRMGLLEGTPFEDQLWRFEKDKDVESTESIYKRVRAFIDGQDDGVVVAVSHGDSISSIAIRLLKLDPVSGFEIKVPNGSMTILERNGRELKLLVLGILEINKEFIGKVPKEFMN